MILETASIFRGVLYHIDHSCDSRDLLRILLDTNGAREADIPKNATRIIIDTTRFATYERMKYNGEIVTVRL
jgi:hypothetical protein